MIFAGIYLPVDSKYMLKPLHDAHEVAEAARTGLPHKPAGVAAPLASVDAMVAEAKRRWAARDMPGEVGYLTIHHVGDQNGYVSIFRAGSDRVALVGEGIHFQASSGKLIREDPPRSAVSSVNEFLTGLHLQHFEHWLLRWFYVFGGLAGAVCIATGFIFFVEKRKRQHAAKGVAGCRVVDALAVTTVTGMLISATAMLVVNRLLPADMAGKGDWEKYSFWASWVLAMGHAFWRTAPVLQAQIAPAWREQCWAVAMLAVIAVLMNWATTGDHLLQTLGLTGPGAYWPVAGLDLSLLATAVLACLAARRLHARERTGPSNSRSKGSDRNSEPAMPPDRHRVHAIGGLKITKGAVCESCVVGSRLRYLCRGVGLVGPGDGRPLAASAGQHGTLT